jgi:transposase
MLSPTAATRVFVATAAVDLRAGFSRLSHLVQHVLAQDPLSGHWFVFSNASRNRLKILYWDGTGLWILAKRLEQGRFSWPGPDGATATLRPEELAALLCGLEVRAKPGWYRR